MVGRDRREIEELFWLRTRLLERHGKLRRRFKILLRVCSSAECEPALTKRTQEQICDVGTEDICSSTADGVRLDAGREYVGPESTVVGIECKQCIFLRCT